MKDGLGRAYDMADFDATVVGAGVVGLAIVRGLALAGRSVLALEAAARIGSETSSRSSEVVHAGLYYPEGSLKARLCVEGRRRLYAYMEDRGVPYRRCGKLLVASEASEVAEVERLYARGVANGVEDLRIIDAREARRLEPALRAAGAVLSPATGILDSHALMVAYQRDAESAGATIALRTPFARAELVREGEIRVHAGGEEKASFTTTVLVNAAGLHASAVAGAIAGLEATYVPRTRYAKGSYLGLSGRCPFTRLIYPAPSKAGLGIHLTIDLGGQARFGPDVEWVDRIDYSVDPGRCADFYAAIRRYWPDLPDGSLTPGYSGIRPKLYAANEAAVDFRIDGPEVHGVPGLVNLFGIESPGLTASLAIASEVVGRLQGAASSRLKLA